MCSIPDGLIVFCNSFNGFGMNGCQHKGKASTTGQFILNKDAKQWTSTGDSSIAQAILRLRSKDLSKPWKGFPVLLLYSTILNIKDISFLKTLWLSQVEGAWVIYHKHEWLILPLSKVRVIGFAAFPFHQHVVWVVISYPLRVLLRIVKCDHVPLHWFPRRLPVTGVGSVSLRSSSRTSWAHDVTYKRSGLYSCY